MINIYNIFARMKFRGILLVFFSVFSNAVSFGQAPLSYTSSEILHHIKKLKVLGSALYIAAHPDDENTRLLGWLSNDQLMRTGYLSITRGDGGQNLIGNEQGIELGASVTLVDRQPFDGPVTVRIGECERTLGGRVARAMRIEVD